MRVDHQAVQVHVVCMEQRYVEACEREVPTQVDVRPLEVDLIVDEVAQVLEILTEYGVGFRAPSASSRSH